jgi:Aerotolerance regulator N-terminal/von Willebrand factor type A domain
MGFLAPWFLGGLAAIGIPIYVHLLRRHTATPRPFSSLMFFERRTQSSIRHRRLRYLLLLSMRLALLVLLVLAFADPFVNRAAAKSAANTLLVLAIDNSVSMRAGSRLADAKREAMSVLDSHRSAQRVQVATLGSELHVLTQPAQDPTTQRAAVASVAPGDSRGSFAEFARAIHEMADAVQAPIEVHLFSDMQRSKMPSSFADAVMPANVELVPHPVAGSAVPNWAVESVTAPGQVWGSSKAGKPVRLQSVVVGFGTPSATRTVSLAINGKIAETKTVQVPASGRATVEFASLDVPYGFSRCLVQIDSADSFVADDEYRFAVERLDPPRALFVHAAADVRSPLYFENALASAAESAFTLQPVTADQAANVPLPKFAFVVVSDIPALPVSLESELAKYVRGGGGVLMAMGTAAAGRGRVPVFGETVQQTHDYTRERSVGHERFVSVGDTDSSHPAVDKTGNWSGVRFFYAARVDATNARVVARLTDQTPLLLDKKMGEGRVLLFASGLDNLTNDFPLNPAFVPFVEKTAQYLSGIERRGGARVVDSFLDLRTVQGKQPVPGLGVEVIDPDGRRPLSLKDAAAAQSFRLTGAGFYQIRLANGRQDVVGVNPDRRASNLDVIPADVQALWAGSAQAPQAASVVVGAAPEEKTRFSLWWYVMVLALAAAVAESWLASRYLGVQHSET